MKNSCGFCERGDELEKRVIYDQDAWYAFLAAPPYAMGHTILARKGSDAGCPTMLSREHLRGFDAAMADVVELLQSHYAPKDILVASLRGKEPHVHWHLVPLWQEQEREWRLRSRYESGHLFEFLADADQRAQSKAFDERVARNWNPDQQRASIANELKSDVQALLALRPRRTSA